MCNLRKLHNALLWLIFSFVIINSNAESRKKGINQHESLYKIKITSIKKKNEKSLHFMNIWLLLRVLADHSNKNIHYSLNQRLQTNHLVFH